MAKLSQFKPSYYRAVYHCPSLHPTDGTQRFMSDKSKAGPELVAEVRALLAEQFHRQPDEIEIVAIQGVSDPGQFWPPRTVAAGVIESKSPTVDSGAEVSAADINAAAQLLIDGVRNQESPATPPVTVLPDAPVVPAWTPATPPVTAFPTIEAAGQFTKQQMLDLSAKLKIAPDRVKDLKFPELRQIVLGALQSVLTGQSAAA